MESYKHLYSECFSEKVDYFHFAAHSHHPWPDATLDAQIQYWKDSAHLLDQKWSYVFEQVIPQAQQNIAEVLNVSKPEMIVFAPNTHEFVVRILSCFTQPIKVLTTDSEFHSFRRQIQSSKAAGQVDLTIVPVAPYETFPSRWIKEATSGKYDLVFTSHTFFNSGLTCPKFRDWIPEVPKSTHIVIDAYHSFFAIPTDLKAFEDRIFFIAGGYKYAQAGEGACFMLVPESSTLRPVNTGWFASFSTLSSPSQEKIHYSDNGLRFAGATFDPSGIYRFNAVIDMYKENDLSVELAHEHVQTLKAHFVEKTRRLKSLGKLVMDGDQLPQSHYLTFINESANKFEELLRQNNIIVDSRGDRLRFGFGIYHDISDIDMVADKLGEFL